MKKVIALFFCLVGPPAFAADTWLVDDFTATYKAKVGVARGETRLAMRRVADGTGADRFIVESWTELKGLLSLIKPGKIHEFCEFDFVDGQIRPRRFTRSDDVSREDRNVEVVYDWDTQEAIVSYQGGETTIEIENGVSNTLVMQIALMQSLSSGKRTPWFDVVGHKGRLRFDVNYEGSEPLATDSGAPVLYRYSHSRADSGIRTTFWAAPERAHLPLRAEITKGKKLKGRLNLTQAPAPASRSAD